MRQFQKILHPMVAVGILAATTSSIALAQNPVPKVAVINVVQLLEESDPGKQGINDLKELQKIKSDGRNALRSEVQQIRSQLTEGQFSLSEDKLAELQKQLEDKGIALQRFNDDAARELQKSQEKMLEGIQSLVMPIINAVGEEYGYTMIFNKFESGLVYASDAIDITPLVMERLNQSAAADEATADAPSADDPSSGS